MITRSRISLLALFVAGSLAGCGQTSPEEHLSAAKQKMASGESQAAVIELKNAISQAPTNTDARKLLGEIYVGQGNYQAAVKEFDKALEAGLEPAAVAAPLSRALLKTEAFNRLHSMTPPANDATGKSAVLLRQAVGYFRTQNPDKAQSYLQQAAEEGDNQYSELASIYLTSIRDVSKANGALGQLIEKNPDFIDAVYLSGQLSSAVGQHQEAAQRFQDYLAMVPEEYTTRLFLADALLKSSQYESAQKHVDFILKMSENQPFANQINGMLAFQSENYEQAQLSMERAIQNGMDTPPNRLVAGMAAFKAGNLEQAHSHLEGVASQLVDDHPAKKAFAIVQMQLGYNIAASDTLSELEGLTPEDSDLYAAATYELIKVGELSRARDALRRAESFSKDSDAIDLTKIGTLKLSMEEVGGIADLEKALQMEPDLPQAKLALAAAYLKTEQYDKALKLAEQWQKEDSERLDGYNLAGMVFSAQNKTREAIEAFQKSLKIDSNNVTALLYLAQHENKQGALEQAFDYISRAVKGKPNHIPALTFYYQIGQKLGQSEAPKKAIERALKKHSDEPAYQLLGGLLAHGEGDFQKTIEILSNVRDPSRMPSSYWLTLSSAYAKQGEHEKIQAVLERWTKAQPKREQSWLSRVSFLMKVGNNLQALAVANDALSQLPDSLPLDVVHADLLIRTDRLSAAKNKVAGWNEEIRALPLPKRVLGHIKLKEGKHEAALPLLTASYGESPTFHTAALIYLAHSANSNNDKGLEFLEQHVANYSSDTRAIMILANEYLAKKPEKAIKHYEKAVEINNENVLALNNLAFLLQQRGELEKADRYAQKAVALAPDNPDVLDTAGVIKLDLGEGQQALELLKKANELAPNNKLIKANFEKVKAALE